LRKEETSEKGDGGAWYKTSGAIGWAGGDKVATEVPFAGCNCVRCRSTSRSAHAAREPWIEGGWKALGREGSDKLVETSSYSAK